MAPSVKPAARLSERPFFPAVGIRHECPRVDSPAGDEWSRGEAPISRASLQRRFDCATAERLLLPVGRGPAFGVLGRGLAAAALLVASSGVRRPSWTSDQARRPAELKHINKRRKSN